MRLISTLSSIFLSIFVSVMACTNLLAGKDATQDGSTMITYSADSYFLFGSLYHYPAATYPKGTMLEIHEWDTGKYLGEIKQVEQTYSVIGNMNEFQVTIAETTFGGRQELRDTTGIMDYGNLMYVALQRSKSAREAIHVMTSLVEEYGYYSGGESFSIADPNEVWIMEMIGKGLRNKGAVWVALRLPDDCVSAHANHARITSFPFDDQFNCMYSSDVIAFAREKGYFKGKNSEFSFSDVYAPIDYGALRACEARVWSFFKHVDSTMEKYISYVKGETFERMPLWIKPNHKLSLDDMKAYMRDQYEGTEFDMTQGFGAGSHGNKVRLSPLSFTIDGEEYYHERPIATQQTGFSFVAQMRNWLPSYLGGILWFGVDDAVMSVYVPMYCGIHNVPECFSDDNGSLFEYSSTSAFWIFNQVAQFAYPRYNMVMPDIEKVQRKWETNFQTMVYSVDQAAVELSEQNARDLITEFSHTQASNIVTTWEKLGEFLLVKYLDGVVKIEKDGVFQYNEKKIPETILRPGYSEEYLKKLIRETPNMKAKTEEELRRRGR